MSEKLRRLESLLQEFVSLEKLRKENIAKLQELFKELEIDQKVAWEDLFGFQAMNLMGISLQKEQLAQPQPNRYAQIIAIKNGKNSSLRYFGRAENLDPSLIKKIVEFVLRWRLEKSFFHVENYRDLVDALNQK
ncbi:hypothetical protein [Nitratiruptor sp. YY09-18]|uniref:hypothetical protein n=1 Tax=Nitratiruptor sp. YY09-18 TaxID=2724901 RepID=UPI0019155764|nr:hypothetical protein [Nitratiruptor sp. YY09-18]BCD68120.1 hypothetical protein NitYY0918_C1031 [Nitratiruptor sp. YY09-18]